MMPDIVSGLLIFAMLLCYLFLAVLPFIIIYFIVYFAFKNAIRNSLKDEFLKKNSSQDYGSD